MSDSTAIVIKDQDKRVAEALRLHASATASAAQMAIAAAKCGLELKALKKEAGHGTWENFFADNFESHGLTLRTAQKYMALADGLKGRALKNESGSFLKLLECAPSELKPAEQEKLTKAVGKVTDGKTLSELYQDFGIVKKPQGSGAKGGAKVSTKTEEAPADPVQTEAQIAREHTERFVALLKEELTDKKFNAASEKLRKELHGLLVDLTSAVKETL